MGTELVGKVELANGQQVWIVVWEHEPGTGARAQVEQLRKSRVTDVEGNPIDNLGAVMFGLEEDGSVGVLTEVTFEQRRQLDEAMASAVLGAAARPHSGPKRGETGSRSGAGRSYETPLKPWRKAR
jgi:hypothetical protein